MSREDAANVIPPVTFLSFPSAKDSTWEARHPGMRILVDIRSDLKLTKGCVKRSSHLGSRKFISYLNWN